MDINKLVNETTDRIIESKLPEIIEEKVTKMISGIVDNIFRTYSDTGKEIEKRIAESLRVNLGRFDLVDYAGLVTKHVNEQLVRQVNMEPITELIRNTVGIVNAEEMNLSEIIDWAVKQSMEDNSCDSDGSISLHIERSDRFKWLEVFIDHESEKSKEECEVCFLISDSNCKIFSVRAGSYWWKNQKEVDALTLARMSDLAHRVFRLYAAGVKVNIDVDDAEDHMYWDRY